MPAIIFESVSRKAKPIVKPTTPREANKAVVRIPAALSATTNPMLKMANFIIVSAKAALVLSMRFFKRGVATRFTIFHIK